MGLNVEAWRLLSKYAFLFSKKERRGGLASPHSPGAVLLLFVQVDLVSKQSSLLWGGGGGAAEIGSYNKITKFLKNTS